MLYKHALIIKYITVATFRIYVLHDEDATERALNSHGNYIVDHGKS